MRFRERIILWCYIGAINVLIPLGVVIGLPFLWLKEKRRETIFPRLGFQRIPVTSDPRKPLWIHALSLGETLSCTLLIEALRARLGPYPIFFSASTLSAMQIAQERIRPLVNGMFYFPLDLWWPARRLLRKVSPRLIAFIETDVWPGFQHQLQRTGTPAVLVNGRLSPKTYRACERFRSLFAPALNSFHRIYPQSEGEAARYLRVGVQKDRIGEVGNLKFDVAGRMPSAREIDALRIRVGLNPSTLVFIAGSTHPTEEEKVLRAFYAVLQKSPASKLIIVPRNPSRAPEVSALLEGQPIHGCMLSLLARDQAWDVLIVDVMGALPKLYHLATASFIGGSLVPKGGQNPLESAAAGCPVLFGPDMSDFPDIASWMLQEGAAHVVRDESELADRWAQLLTEPEKMMQMKESCRRIIHLHCGVTALIAEELVAMISRLEREDTSPGVR